MADKRGRGFVEQRRQTILNILREKGRVNVADLAEKLGISSLTVRRDLDELESRGQVTRRYGEALLADGAGIQKAADPFEAAKRELGEECGLTADHYTPLGEFYPTVGYDTEIIYMWVATGLHTTQMHLDYDEFLTPDRIPLAKAYEMVMRNEIKDGKTIAGVLKLKALVDEGKL